MTKEIDYRKDDYKFLLITAFNRLNVEYDQKKAKEFLIEYTKLFGTKEQQERARRVKTIPNTIGWLCRLRLDGAVLSEDHITAIENEISSSKEVDPEPVEEKEEKKSPRQFVEEQASEYLGELEHVLDMFMFDNVDFSLYNDMRANQITLPYVSIVRSWVQNKIKEFSDVDLDVYSFGKRTHNALMKFLSAMEEDCDRYQNFKKANRKPRAKKKIAPIIQVKNLNYQKECEEFGLKSVQPALIIGASQVWVFNTKLRKLGVYHSDSVNGLRVKGSTLQGFSPDTSIQKTVRNPKAVLPLVLDSGKVQLRKILPDLTTKESVLTGRINSDTIILRVI